MNEVFVVMEVKLQSKYKHWFKKAANAHRIVKVFQLYEDAFFYCQTLNEEEETKRREYKDYRFDGKYYVARYEVEAI